MFDELKGFLAIFNLPSEELFKVMLPEIFEGRLVGERKIRIITKYFVNRLKRIKAKFKRNLESFSVSFGIGNMKIYIIEAKNVIKLMRLVEIIKSDLSELQRQIREFIIEGRVPEELRKRNVNIQEDYIATVRRYLERCGIPWSIVVRRVEAINLPDRVRVMLAGFTLDPEDIKRMLGHEVPIEYIKEQARKTLLESLRDDIKAIIEKIERIRMAQIKMENVMKIRREIEQLVKKARLLGINMPYIERLAEIANTPLERLRIQLKNTDNVDSRLRSLLEML